MNQELQIQNEIDQLRAEENNIRAELGLRENDYNMQRNSLNAQMGGYGESFPKKSPIGPVLLILGVLGLGGGFGLLYYALGGEIINVFKAFLEGPYDHFKMALEAYLVFNGMETFFNIGLIAFVVGFILIIVGIIVTIRSGKSTNRAAAQRKKISSSIMDLDARYQSDVSGLQSRLNLISSQIAEKESQLSEVRKFAVNSAVEEEITEKIPRPYSPNPTDERREASNPSLPNPADERRGPANPSLPNPANSGAALPQSDIVKFYCPHCGQKLGAPKRMFLRGQVECSRCHKLIDTSTINRLVD